MFSASAPRDIAVNILTASYRLVGKLRVTPSSGVVGLLGNPNTSFIEVQDVSMARIHEPRKLAARMDLVRVVKRGIVVVGVSRREDLGPESITRGGFGGVTAYNIRCLTTSYELEGMLEWAGRLNLALVLVEGRGEFVPMYDVQVRAVQFSDLFFETSAIVFNRRKVDIITALNPKNE